MDTTGNFTEVGTPQQSYVTSGMYTDYIITVSSHCSKSLHLITILNLQFTQKLSQSGDPISWFWFITSYSRVNYNTSTRVKAISFYILFF